jgi:hypothetical protein
VRHHPQEDIAPRNGFLCEPAIIDRANGSVAADYSAAGHRAPVDVHQSQQFAS